MVQKLVSKGFFVSLELVAKEMLASIDHLPSGMKEEIGIQCFCLQGYQWKTWMYKETCLFIDNTFFCQP